MTSLKSPIYCDNRKLMSYPAVRNFIKVEFARIILEKYPHRVLQVLPQVIAPAVSGRYVRTSLSIFGLHQRSWVENLIEGDLTKAKVVVIEDLIYRSEQFEAVVPFVVMVPTCCLLAIFTYNFPVAQENMNKARVELTHF